MAYNLLADMRIALFRKLDALAPAYLLRRRSGDLVGLATQDVETVEYFYAHTVTPAVVALLTSRPRSSSRSAIVGLAGRARAAAVPAVMSASAPVLRAAAHRPARRARRAKASGGSTRMSPTRSRASSELVAFQAVGRRRAEFMRIVRDYHDCV